MPTLRIYFDAFFNNSLEEIQATILADQDCLAKFDKDNNITDSGFFKEKKVIFRQISGTEYHVANYLLKQFRKVPSKNSELIYFKILPQDASGEEVEYPFPTLIKLIVNKGKGILCLYSRRLVQNDTADALLDDLRKKDGFEFKYRLIGNQYVFRRNELDDFLLALSDMENFTAIAFYDEDNKIIAKNDETLSETPKIQEFKEQVKKGNWENVQLINENLGFEIRLSNKRTQNFLTFVNDYQDDEQMISAIDYLVEKIRNTTQFELKKQTILNGFIN